MFKSQLEIHGSSTAAHLLEGGPQLQGRAPKLIVVAAAAGVAVRGRQVVEEVRHGGAAVGIARVLEARRKTVDLRQVPARAACKESS